MNGSTMNLLIHAHNNYKLTLFQPPSIFIDNINMQNKIIVSGSLWTTDNAFIWHFFIVN